MLNVVVKRSEWGRGTSPQNSRLFNPETGLMCCMGFACLAAGLTKEQIYDRSAVCSLLGIPAALQEFHQKQEMLVVYDDEGIYVVNDLPSYVNRENRLIELGKTCGIAFTFED